MASFRIEKDLSLDNLSLGSDLLASNITMPTIDASAINGFITLTNVAGVPTGAPIGEGQLAYDTVSNDVYVHEGSGTWNVVGGGGSNPDLSAVLAVGNNTGNNDINFNGSGSQSLIKTGGNFDITLNGETFNNDTFYISSNSSDTNALTIRTVNSTGGPVGNINIIGGLGVGASSGGSGGPIQISSGQGGAGSANGGGAGNLSVTTGNGGSAGFTGGNAGDFSLITGNGGNGSTPGKGGDISLTAGNAGTGGNANGGSVTIQAGNKNGTGVAGAINLTPGVGGITTIQNYRGTNKVSTYTPNVAPYVVQELESGTIFNITIDRVSNGYIELPISPSPGVNYKFIIGDVFGAKVGKILTITLINPVGFGFYQSTDPTVYDSEVRIMDINTDNVFIGDSIEFKALGGSTWLYNILFQNSTAITFTY